MFTLIVALLWLVAAVLHFREIKRAKHKRDKYLSLALTILSLICGIYEFFQV
jgi:formate hydrogenlyase subunit 3/multisubunit Na+/H+ antiporter MnhD subunit